MDTEFKRIIDAGKELIEYLDEFGFVDETEIENFRKAIENYETPGEDRRGMVY